MTVVSEIRRALPVFESSLPESVKISYEFDESPTVKQAIRSVATEGLIGATLTGLMILLFLHDWRSVVVVVFNIPMALLGSLLGLWLTDNTINIMTLGGLALAIGMLVDEATVSIENIHVQMTRTASLARAVERGSNEAAVPRLLAMLCILSVFIPALLMVNPPTVTRAGLNRCFDGPSETPMHMIAPMKDPSRDAAINYCLVPSDRCHRSQHAHVDGCMQ